MTGPKIEEKVDRRKNIGKRGPRTAPVKVSMCGPYGPCVGQMHCKQSYSNTGWFTDEHGIKTRIIEGGVCIRANFGDNERSA